MIKEYIVKKVLEVAFEGAKKLLKESGRKVISTRDDNYVILLNLIYQTVLMINPTRPAT